MRGLVIALLVTLTPAAVAGTDMATGTWWLRTPLGDAGGRYRLLSEPDAGQWRLEIMLDLAEAPATDVALADRAGRGWTLCGGEDGTFLQPWDEKWHQLGVEAGGFLRSLAALPLQWFRSVAEPAGSPAGDRTLILRDWADLPEFWRPIDWRTTRGGRLRRQMVARGLGRGGPGLVLDARFGGSGLVLTTARWPVTIEAAVSSTQLDGPDWPAEAYLPLWPLSEFER